MKRLTPYFLFIIIILVGFLVYIEWRFKQTVHPQTTANYASKIWSHRGVHFDVPENTLAAYHLAKRQHFTGIEIDVYYDEANGLMVTHDVPEETEKNDYLRLNEVINDLGADLSYWIDLKNLTQRNKNDIIRLLQQIFDENPNVKEQLFIESGNGLVLRKLAQKDINCIYWVQYARQQPKQYLKLLYIKALIGHSNFKGISTHFRYMDVHFKEQFQRLNWYVFTVNSPKHLQRLSNFKQVAVILTDLKGEDVFTDEE